MAAPLTKQLDGVISSATLQMLENDNRSITHLVIRGYLGDAAAHKARLRLLKNCQREAAKHLNESNIAVSHDPSAKIK